MRGSVGLACLRDPADLNAFSGTPRALLDALRDLGVQVVPLRAGLDPRLEAHLARALAIVRTRSTRDLPSARALRHRPELRQELGGGELIWLRNRKVRRAVRRARVGSAIHHGTQYRLPPTLPYVTFEDSTVLQARRAYPWPHLEVSDSAFARSVDRQRSCYEAARACCTETHWAARSVVEDYGQPAERVKVVGVGSVLTPRPVTDRNWSTPRFLFVGGAWKRKNGDRTVAAFRAVRERHPDAELHLVGTHPRVDVPGVIGHGWLALEDPTERARLEMLFEQATCLVLPSLHEPAGTVHVEAAATGVASIGSTNGGAATLIGDTGLLVDPESEDEIVAAMLKLAEPAVAASLGALALGRSSVFTWRKVAERLLRALAPPGIDVAPLAEFL